MSFLTPFKFDKTSLFTVTIDGKVWTRAKEVIHGALRYKKSTKTAYEVRAHCSPENYAHKCELAGHSAGPLKWPSDSQKYDLYINEEGLLELVWKSNQPAASELARKLGIDVHEHKYVRKETTTLSHVQKSFKREAMIKQYHVDG